MPGGAPIIRPESRSQVNKYGLDEKLGSDTLLYKTDDFKRPIVRKKSKSEPITKPESKPEPKFEPIIPKKEFKKVFKSLPEEPRKSAAERRFELQKRMEISKEKFTQKTRKIVQQCLVCKVLFQTFHDCPGKDGTIETER